MNKRLTLLILVLGVILFFLLRPVFDGSIILPQVFHIGPVALRYYGLILAIAVIVGYWLAASRAPRYGLTIVELDRVVLLLVICGFVGARLYHVVSEVGFYQHHLGQVFALWQGGLSIFGAMIGGVIGLFIARSWLVHQPILKLLDWLAPSLLIGQIIGRFGNFFNYEIFGYPTNLPWKMFVPAQFRLPDFLTAEFFHPLFLYEALLNGLFLIILLKFVGSTRRAGSLFFSYLFLYNGGRFFLESLRPDSVFVGSLRLNSLVSAALSLFGLVGVIYLHYASTPTSNS